jgi:uncharacterized SAM-binding protein YcdF (DUF218 family)
VFEYPLISRLVHPYAPLVLLLGLAMAWVCWKGRFSRIQRLLILGPYLLLLAMSLPGVSFLAFWSLEEAYPPSIDGSSECDAIVILGGYVSASGQRRDYAVLGADTLSRCLHGASLLRRGEPCYVIVSGGKNDAGHPGPTVAEAMRDFLVTQGVPGEHILLEDRSRNTFENARESAKLIDERGFRHVILVTDAASLLRADLCFRKHDTEVIPSGCRYRASGPFPWSIASFVPSVDAAKNVSDAWHEWLGLAWYWWRGQI